MSLPTSHNATPKEEVDEEVVTLRGVPSIPDGEMQNGTKYSSMQDDNSLKNEDYKISLLEIDKSEDVDDHDTSVKTEPDKLTRSTRTSVKKMERRPPVLFWDHEDKTTEATSTFGVLDECVYANKQMGTTEPALECDCAEEWDATTQQNYACGEDSDCINRATKMECIGDCGCGSDCQNQRFQRREYAQVTVIKTAKKGYGLRVDTDLKPNDFIFEYIGEVIGENVFRRRMQQYDEEGIKHFYFMSLNKGEFVDATKRGNLGRFCNHSCNPNCYVDKWVVGDKLRMGIFAERKIQAGEELVFNYNVDRYGADPQPCYCGEPNCSGYIGGKTQTGGAIKLSHTMIEALGIEDAQALDAAAARRPRKKKVGEEDEDYVNKFEPRGLDEEGVNKVMSSLMQCKEKWIAVKLLSRIQRADDERVWNRVVRFHGYRIMKTVLSTFAHDVNVCLQVLEVLDRMPRLTRNKIQDSKIEDAVTPLVENEDERVSSQASGLLEAWSKLEVAYRIPRMKRDPNVSTADRKGERRDVEQRPSQMRSPDRIIAPTGPRNKGPARPAFRAKFRAPAPIVNALPSGWFEATAASGTSYYYTSNGTTTWVRPTQPAASAPPPPPPRAVSDQQRLQDLIKNIVSAKIEPSRNTSASTTPAETPGPERKQDKWQSLSEDKRRKVYEGAIQPHIMHVVAKYKARLPKDDLKRWARELAKKMVDSDFRKGKVENPSKISDKQIKSIRKHAQDFFEKAAKKKADADARNNVSNSSSAIVPPDTSEISATAHLTNGRASQKDEDIVLSDVEDDDEQDRDPRLQADTETAALKRHRSHEFTGDGSSAENTLKRHRVDAEDDSSSLNPPPPPPPPPDDFDDSHEQASTEWSAHGGPSVTTTPNGTTVQQTATPPTTGSPEIDNDNVDDVAGEKSREKELVHDHYAGMNPSRMQQLGLGRDFHGR